MPRILHAARALACAAAVAALAVASVPRPASANPVAHFVMSTDRPQAGQPVVFDGSGSVCDQPTGCGYQWQWFWRSADGTTTHLGGQMGRDPVVTYTFNDLAASHPYVIVSLTVGAGRLVAPSTASTSFVVLPSTADAGPSPSRTVVPLAIDNAPDPFVPATTIRYSVPRDGMVRVGVFDLAGRRVRGLVQAVRPAGVHTVEWNGRNDAGERVKAGVYFARIVVGSQVATDRLTISN